MWRVITPALASAYRRDLNHVKLIWFLDSVHDMTCHDRLKEESVKLKWKEKMGEKETKEAEPAKNMKVVDI